MRRPAMRPWLSALALVMLVVSGKAHAVLCASDEVPAATLLVPHFRVDLDSCGVETGLNTVVTLVNTSADSTVAHMTFWTDWGVPTINFSFYLTGFDQQTIDLAAAFCDGVLPLTGPIALSNHGALSGPAPSLPTCELIEGSISNPVITGVLFDRLRNGHTGVFDGSFSGCVATDHGDNVARGYLTFDVVADCALFFPSDPFYFDEVALTDNVLMGEVLYVGPDRFQSLPAVHVEADAQGGVFPPGDHTFYGRYVGGDASDRREPLPTRFAALHSKLTGGAELMVWREATGTGPVACGTLPASLPLEQRDILAFDEEENPLGLTAAFDLASNVVPLDQVVPPGVADLGWLVLDERHDGLQGVYGDDRAQAWVSYLSEAAPVASISGRETYVLDNTCSSEGFVLPQRVFADGFESGNTSAWSNAIP